MGFGLHDRPPQISQSEGFVVDFSIVWGEVNFHCLFLSLYGLECSIVLDRGVVCECCCMLVSNIFGVCDGKAILPIQIFLGRANIFTRHLPHSIPCMLNMSISWHLWDIFCPRLTFLWLRSRWAWAWAWALLKADTVSPLSSQHCRTHLSRTHLAFRACQHSTSNQGFDFLGMVIALRMLSFAALVWSQQKSVEGLFPLGCPQWSLPSTDRETFPNRPWKTPNVKDHSSVVSLPLVVG